MNLVKGGQGKVYRVRDSPKFNIAGADSLFEIIVNFVQEFSHDTNIRIDNKKLRESRVESFDKAAATIILEPGVDLENVGDNYERVQEGYIDYLTRDERWRLSKR